MTTKSSAPIIWGIDKPVFQKAAPVIEETAPTAAPATSTRSTVAATEPTWGFHHPNGQNGVSGAWARNRTERTRQIRRQAAQIAYERQHPRHVNNGDEARYPNRIGNFSKGLPHNALGEVDPAAYETLLTALRKGNPESFEEIKLGLGRKLVNPQAGLAFDLQGADAHALTIPPAPALASAEAAGEMVELYWMALLRDVHFSDFDRNDLIAEAAASISRLYAFKGPKDPQTKRVTPATIFRGSTRGDLIGPYLSQFMLMDIPYGSLRIEQLNETVAAGHDYMTDYDAWLHIQNGGNPPRDRLDKTRRYLRNMRDLGRYVQVDALYEAYLNAALILLSLNVNSVLDDAGNFYKRSHTQHGFGTFGGPHILSLVTEIATRALKAVWHQKWYVHRRLRPEAYGGLVHNHLQRRACYPLHSDVLNSDVLDRVYQHNGRSHLLPMAFPEGSPTHPAYGAGHATVAGACVTILKAWFDETFVLRNPIVSNHDGTKLVPYTGPDAGRLTVGNELNKLAANIAIGRNMAGVHWRTDYSASIRLGEEVAITVLEEQSLTYNEPNSFTFTRFDGTQVLIKEGKTTVIA
jgi:hypothetical protein